MIKFLVFLFGIELIVLVKSECSHEYNYLYCTNTDTTVGNGTSLESKEKSENSVNAAYLRNVTGQITHETLLNFPNIQSLDIQFSTIDEFAPNMEQLNTLYVMNNFKFPNLTKDMLQNCCTRLEILLIVNNTGLVIENGALRSIENLTQLTISQQNISEVTAQLLQGMDKLTYLNLRQNKIVSINENAFENLTKLNYLDLSGNNINHFETATFFNLTVLETLHLFDLKIEKFNTSVFIKQKELKELGLPTSSIKNKLKLESLIRAFPKLETIGVSEEDKDGESVVDFVQNCKVTGYNIKYTKIVI